MSKQVCVHQLPKKSMPTAKAVLWVVRLKGTGPKGGPGSLVGPFRNMGSARAWAAEWCDGLRVCVLPVVCVSLRTAHLAERLSKCDDWPSMEIPEEDENE